MEKTAYYCSIGYDSSGVVSTLFFTIYKHYVLIQTVTHFTRCVQGNTSDWISTSQSEQRGII